MLTRATMRVVALALIFASGAFVGCGASQPKTNALGMTELTQADLDGPGEEADKDDVSVPASTSGPNPDQYDVTIAPSPEPPPRKAPRPRHMKPPSTAKHGTLVAQPAPPKP